MGPVQVLVVGVGQPSFTGEVLNEFSRLRDAGVVRLVDVLLVSRSEDGTLRTLPPPDGLPADLGRVAAAFFGQSAGAGDGAADAAGGEASGLPRSWSLADVVPPGTTVAVAMIEHLWAGPLREAIQQAGGAPLEETWLGADDARLLEELLAEVDA